MPAREYRLDIIVDDHGAVQKLTDVAKAEDQVTTSAQKSADVIDIFGKKKAALAEQAGKLTTSLRDEYAALDTVTISEAEADRALSDLHTTMRGVPSTLATVRGGLNDVASGAGLTVEGLGLLESGLLVVGVAYESVKFGRWIADLTGADAKIADITASTLGWGSITEQTAGAVGDVLANATAIAGRNITNLSEAIQIVNHDYQAWMDTMARADAPKQSAAQVNIWRGEILLLGPALRSLTADIESHNFTQKELADRYRISTGALALHERELRDAAQAQRDLTAAEREWEAGRDKALQQALAAIDANIKREEDFVKIAIASYDMRQAREKELTDFYTQQTNKRIIAAFQEAQAQQKVLDEFNKSMEVMPEVGHGADDLGGHVDTLAGKVFSFARGLMVTNDELSAFYDQIARGGGVGIGDTRSGSGAIGTPVGSGQRIPHFDKGGPVERDGLIFAHAGEYVQSRDEVNRGSAGGISIAIDARGAHFEDDAAIARLADRVSRAIGPTIGVRSTRG